MPNIPSQPTLEIGSTLGSFRLLSQLGEGGMGIVFLAEDLKLGRRVALKVMQPRVGSQQHIRARFLREARTASLMEHERIVRVYQVDEDRGVPFIAMELLRGESLDQYLSKQPVPSLRHCFKIALHIAQGLAVAHRKGLIHRDIKPSNVWMEAVESKSGFRCKLLDFGLAREVQGDSISTQSGKLMGTPAYMSPEQWRGKDVDHRSDLFSLGAVVYQMMTGQLPFGSGPTIEIARAIAIEDPVPPIEINPRVPLPLSELVMQMLEKSKQQRPMNAEEVIARLEAFAEQREPDHSKWSSISFGMAADYLPETETPRHAFTPPPRSHSRFPSPSYLPTEPQVPVQSPGLKYALVGSLLTLLVAGLSILGFLLFSGRSGDKPVVDARGVEQAKQLEEQRKRDAETESRLAREQEEAKRLELEKRLEKQRLDTEDQKRREDELQKKLDIQKAEAEFRRRREEALQKLLEQQKLDEERRIEKKDQERDNITRMLQAGKKLLDQHDYDGAIETLTNLLVIDPKNSLAYSYRSWAWEMMGDNEWSVRDADKGVELAPNSGYALAMRGYALNWERHGQIALEDCNRAIKLDPRSGFAYSTRGALLSYLTPDEDDRAREDLDRGIELDPTAYAYCCRGDLFQRQNDYEKALADYSYAIKLEPRFAYAYSRRAGAYRDPDNRAKALADLDKAIELGPKQPSTYAGRSRYYTSIGEFEKALVDAQRSLDLNRKYIEGYLCRADANRSLGRNLQARADCEKGLEIDPKSPDLYQMRGHLSYTAGQFEDAIDDYTRAIENAHRPAYLYLNRADAYRLLKKFDAALEDCNKAIEFEKKTLAGYFTRASVYEEQKLPELAIRDYSRIIELDPKNSVAYSSRGQLYIDQSEDRKALADGNKAIECNPKNAFGYNVRGHANLELKLYDKAVDDYTKAIELLPNYSALYRNRSDAYLFREGVGDADRSKADLDEADRLDRLRKN